MVVAQMALLSQANAIPCTQQACQRQQQLSGSCTALPHALLWQHPPSRMAVGASPTAACRGTVCCSGQAIKQWHGSLLQACLMMPGLAVYRLQGWAAQQTMGMPKLQQHGSCRVSFVRDSSGESPRSSPVWRPGELGGPGGRLQTISMLPRGRVGLMIYGGQLGDLAGCQQHTVPHVQLCTLAQTAAGS